MLKFFREKMKIILITVAVIFAATMFYGIGSVSLKRISSPQADMTLAKVDGQKVDEFRFRQMFSQISSQFSGRQSPQTIQYVENLALNQAIEFTLLLKDAKKNTRVRPEELDGAISSILQQNKIPSLGELKKLLGFRGINFDDFKNSIKDDILVQKRVRDVRENVQISPDDLREISVSHILIRATGSSLTEETAARGKAEDILKRVNKGEDFSRLARQFSEDPGSAKEGGNLGFFGMGMMVPEFEAAAFALKPGEHSALVKTQYGYHIIKLDETRLKRSPDMKKDIKEAVLAEKKERAFRNWMYGLKSAAKVEIINPSFKAWDLRMKGKVNEAIDIYNLAVSSNPNDPYPHLFLADCYKEIGQDQFAITEYKKAASLAPTDPFTHISLGNFYIELSKRDKVNGNKLVALAKAEYSSAASVSGTDIDLRKQLVDIFKSIGSFDDARIQDAEIKKIEKKAEFEKQIREKLLRKTTVEAK